MEKTIKIFKNISQKLSGNSLWYCALALVLVLLVVGLAQSRSAIKTKKAELEAIQMQCELQQIENDALDELLKNSDDEYIERKAREELDYVLPGERVYIVRSGN